MSELALISDIHGNGVALDAVLTDLARRGVGQVVCLGDLAAGGPQPHEVIATVRELDCPVVRGNADRWLLEGLPPGRSAETRRLGEVVAWARERLAPADLDHLAALPQTRRIGAAAGPSLFCFHGSPRADLDSLLATTPEAELDDLLAEAPQATLNAAGHTHLQLLRRHRDCPWSTPAASACRSARSPLRRPLRGYRPGPSTPSCRTTAASRSLSVACASTLRRSPQRRRRCRARPGPPTSNGASGAGTRGRDERRGRDRRARRACDRSPPTATTARASVSRARSGRAGASIRGRSRRTARRARTWRRSESGALASGRRGSGR
jgi:predicted phosphodiesterase